MHSRTMLGVTLAAAISANVTLAPSAFRAEAAPYEYHAKGSRRRGPWFARQGDTAPDRARAAAIRARKARRKNRK